jgi:hypothetical protein
VAKTNNLPTSVRRPSPRFPVLASQSVHHQVVLRLLGPVLLQRQQPKHAPGLRQRVRLASSRFHQVEAWLNRENATSLRLYSRVLPSSGDVSCIL